MNSAETGEQLLSDDQVEHKTNLSRTTRWRMERTGAFPRRVLIGRSRVAWVASEIDQWIAERMAEREQV